MTSVPSTPAELGWLLEGLDDNQRLAVCAPHAPLAIVAGAGSGKTRTVTHRIAYQVASGWAPPRGHLAVTHTTKAAAELAERLMGLHPDLAEVHTSTVHAAAWRVVRRFWPEASTYTLTDSTFLLVRDTLSRLGAPTDVGVVADTASELEWAAAHGLGPGTYPATAADHNRTPPVGFDVVARAMEAYADLKRQRLVIDFGDVLRIATELLADAAVADRVCGAWSAVVVDEYQDTDPAQDRFLQAVRARRDLWTVCGDPRQTIYSFKGADPGLLEAACSDPSTTVVHLSTSWRCSTEVLGWANAVVGSSYGPPLTSSLTGPRPQVLASADAEGEPAVVIDQLHAWRRSGIRFEDMAVLYRFNAVGARYEAALAEAHIPYQVFGGQRFFDRPEVKAVLVPFGRAARNEPERDGLELISDIASSTGFDPLRAPPGQGAARARWESVTALVELCTEHSGPAANLLTYLLSVAKGAGVGVNLATIHAAKGLEWPAVVVVGAVEGQLPSSYATSDDQIEEERRLFYVALTRAKTNLAVTAYAERNGRYQRPSRFLYDLPAVLPAMLGRRSGGSGSRSKSHSGGRTTSGSGVRPYSRPDRDSAVEVGSAVPSLAVVAPQSGCDICGARLVGAPARKVRRCSGACLNGPAASRYGELVAWRSSEASRLDRPEVKVATDRALFALAATGDVVLGFAADTTPPPLSTPLA
jgi:DNA helicase II / ATP-dependent DNA helicase PcrA